MSPRHQVLPVVSQLCSSRPSRDIFGTSRTREDSGWWWSSQWESRKMCGSVFICAARVALRWSRCLSRLRVLLDFSSLAKHPPHVQCESKKFPLGDLTFFIFFTNGWAFVLDFFTHLLNVPIFARLQIFIQLSPILTKLCHIKRDYPVHIICAKCPKCAKTRAFTRLRKSLIALLIVVCGKSL